MTGGSKLGRYQLLARIAAGGMGEIFLARMEGAAGFEKLCVVKRILPHLADDSRFRTMLIGEAQIASNMSHANICHVYSLDETNHQLYMVMEYLEGVTVLQLLRRIARNRGQLDTGFVAGVLQQAAEGLHYAHELRDRNGNALGVVHRDVTPCNLFLTESGVVKIVDFGIAKVQNTAKTDSGAVKGKYAYMAPEQLRGQAIDRRVDVFSLGVVAYEMLTSRRLFQRHTDYLTFRAVMDPAPLDLLRHRPDAPEGVVRVLEQALARDPAARYPTVRQFAAALVEAFGAIRPWSQADISELVRSMFGEEIHLNNTEIAKAIKRSEREPSQAIPVIMRRSPTVGASDRAPVETDFSEEPVQGLFGSASEVRPGGSGGVGVPSPQPHPARLPLARRTLLPLTAVLGSAAAGLALGLWLLGSRAPRRAAAVPPTPPGAAFARGASEPYGAAIHRYERELDQCARDSHEALPGDARATIVVGVDGRARRIAFEPEATDRGKLGGCIRSVLQRVAFPAAADEKELAIGLALYPY